eukprot:3706109-Rhodomonas_salina.1
MFCFGFGTVLFFARRRGWGPRRGCDELRDHRQRMHGIVLRGGVSACTSLVLSEGVSAYDRAPAGTKLQYHAW